MDKERLPRWGWLLLGLVVASFVASILNLVLGVTDDFSVVTIVALMSPVLIFVGVWYDEDKRTYWEHSDAHVVGDVLFVVVGTALGAGLALVMILDFDLPQLAQDVVAMITGFLFGWALFWWRNTDLYREGDGRRG